MKKKVKAVEPSKWMKSWKLTKTIAVFLFVLLFTLFQNIGKIMNKEKSLDIIASIVMFVGKFIIIPIIALIVIIALWSVGIDVYNKHIPCKDWLTALSIVLTLFGVIVLLTWAWDRKENNERWGRNRYGATK